MIDSWRGSPSPRPRLDLWTLDSALAAAERHFLANQDDDEPKVRMRQEIFFQAALFRPAWQLLRRHSLDKLAHSEPASGRRPGAIHHGVGGTFELTKLTLPTKTASRGSQGARRRWRRWRRRALNTQATGHATGSGRCKWCRRGGPISAGSANLEADRGPPEEWRKERTQFIRL